MFRITMVFSFFAWLSSKFQLQSHPESFRTSFSETVSATAEAPGATMSHIPVGSNPSNGPWTMKCDSLKVLLYVLRLEAACRFLHCLPSALPCSLARQSLPGQEFLRTSQVVCGEKKKTPSGILYCTKTVWKSHKWWGKSKVFLFGSCEGVTSINHQNWWLAHHYV